MYMYASEKALFQTYCYHIHISTKYTYKPYIISFKYLCYSSYVWFNYKRSIASSSAVNFEYKLTSCAIDMMEL